MIPPRKQKKAKKAKGKKTKRDKSATSSKNAGKKRKGGKKGKSEKSAISTKSEVREEPQEVISKRVTLANFTCQLNSVNWSDKTIDFHWENHPKCAKEAILIEGSLKVRYLLD